MKKYHLLLILLFTFESIAAMDILTQGNITVTTDDLDGFAYKIPDDNRIGFFDSPERIEKTLFSILNMKHIVSYGVENNLVDDSKASTNVAMRLQDMFPIENSGFNLVEEKKVSLVGEFLKKEEAYMQIQKQLTDSVEEGELIELAQEKYIVNKSAHIQEETRTIDFILVVYNSQNKKEQYYKALELLNMIKSKEITFGQLQKRYQNSETDIETTTLEKFKYDRQNIDLSNKLFQKNNIGIYDGLIDSNSRFSIAKITQINTAKQLSFEDVKENILKDLKQKSAERKFNSLLISLTNDKLKVNEEILGTLRDRYK